MGHLGLLHFFQPPREGGVAAPAGAPASGCRASRSRDAPRRTAGGAGPFCSQMCVHEKRPGENRHSSAIAFARPPTCPPAGSHPFRESPRGSRWRTASARGRWDVLTLRVAVGRVTPNRLLAPSVGRTLRKRAVPGAGGAMGPLSVAAESSEGSLRLSLRITPQTDTP